MPRPNLFIIGAAKCGTTSLHVALDAHRDIYMSELKAPGFFVPEFDYHPKDERWYLELFADGEGCRYVGESSTHYSKRPYYEGVPGRLHEFSPDARILYLMRDPIDRAISHYWHNTRSIRPEFHESRTMLRAIREDPNYRHFGDYAMQLAPWLERFGDAVLPLVFEEMVADPPATLERISGWLGLEREPPTGMEHRNRRGRKVRRPRSEILSRFRHSPIWNALAPLVPGKLRTLARRASIREEAPPTLPDESDAVREFLGPWASEKIMDLERLLDREFSGWGSSHE